MSIDSQRLDEVRHWVDEARRIVVLTGAGISTDSGIPDFRGPQGVWTRNPAAERLATIQDYLADPDLRRAAWQNRLQSPTWHAQPNRGHRAIVTLEKRSLLHALVTQNVDELHQRAGNSSELVIEIHGTMRRAMCWSCGTRYPMTEVLERVRDGDLDPACTRCGGILKSDTISFGQALVPEVIDRAMQVAAEADLLLAIGSTLQVYPAANMVPVARQAGARIVIMNAEPTSLDSLAHALLTGPIGELLPAIAGEAA